MNEENYKAIELYVVGVFAGEVLQAKRGQADVIIIE